MWIFKPALTGGHFSIQENKMSKKHLVLKCLAPDFTAYGGFQWPSEVGAKVVAPDWEPTKECGKGLHGWLNGEGDSGVASRFHEPDAKWLVLEVPSFIELSGKVKFKSAKILFIGSRGECARYIWERTKAPCILGLELTGGDCSTLTGGEGSELRIRYYDTRWRTAIAYVGENGIEAGVAYRLNDKHEFVRAN